MTDYAPFWVISATGREPADELGEARVTLSARLTDFGSRLTHAAEREARAAVSLSLDAASLTLTLRRAAELSDRAEAAFGLARAAAHAESGSRFYAADEGGAQTLFALEEGEAPPENPLTLWAATGLDADGDVLTLIFAAPDDREDAVQAAFDHEVFGPPEYYAQGRDYQGDVPSITVVGLSGRVITGGEVSVDAPSDWRSGVILTPEVS